MALRLESFEFLFNIFFYISYLVVLLPTIIVLEWLGLYRSILRHISGEATLLFIIGICASSSIMIIIRVFTPFTIPWSVPFIFAQFFLIALLSSRFFIRAILRTSSTRKQKKILIYGGGEAGSQTIQTLKLNSEYSIEAIIDDDELLQGRKISGKKIISFQDALKLTQNEDIEQVLLAIPSASEDQRKKIIKKLTNHNIIVKTIPSLSRLISGTADFSELKKISIGELLGRSPVMPIYDLMTKNVSGKSVLVTGAAGSIGTELCRQIIQLYPKNLILLDISEAALHAISIELESKFPSFANIFSYKVGSVLDELFLNTVFSEFSVDTVFHTAAYKHVPMMEKNAAQAMQNNAMGTYTLANISMKNQIENFVLVSTDKAVNPTNFMGASKRLAELICLNLARTAHPTRFSIVRFGNVLGSSGSVVPHFENQIEHGGPLTVTHKDVTRFFMTIGEAAQLVIQASSLARGGETFVLDMGKPIKIFDLAKNMITLSGKSFYFDEEDKKNKDALRIDVVGLREGEKMYEELSHDGRLNDTIHPRIKVFLQSKDNVTSLDDILNNLKSFAKNRNHEQFEKFLRSVADYNRT